MSKLRQEERDAALPQDGAFANEDDLHPSDRAVAGLEAEDEGLDPADRQPGTLADDDATQMDVGTEPRSEETSVDYANDDQETLDGLDELEESVREQAEDRPLGSASEFEP
ncbi:hypothetical protein [Aureimonas leprariae]|uniref:Uncharacterized protein n=1 Tax=Plantimonas leprariae TaxID=2615207 RepID=A0A7V7PQV6_9HYPH|nr:hypothetical protein [Aureimonas leprariae]KAB0680783.1 hypothetical protein F6X38_07265 [Aureimonas leprariae]